jgi:hypothetical protein
MQKRINRLFIYIYLIFSFSGCTSLFNFGFDLYEFAHFRKNGSGKFEIVFSLDRASNLISLGKYMAQDHMEFVSLLIQDSFLATGETIGKIPGISKVTNVHDEGMLHFKLTFEFSDIKALNKAMRQININVDPPGIDYFKMNEKAFVRTHTQSIAKLIEYYQGYDDSLTKSFDLGFFFRNMRYIIRYSFSQEIKKATNSLATIPKDRKSVTIIQRVFNEKEKDLLHDNKIFFKTQIDIPKPNTNKSGTNNSTTKPIIKKYETRKPESAKIKSK